MRDLEKYPILTAELAVFLLSLKRKYVNENKEITCGDMTLLYFDEIFAKLVELESIKYD